MDKEDTKQNNAITCNRKDKKHDQSLPNKPKKRNNKLTEEDKLKIKQYYLDLEQFNLNNEKIVSTPKYECNYSKEKDYYSIIEYDHQAFESFGVMKDKELQLTATEVAYLHQIGLISLKGFEMNLTEENVHMFHLYSYLRRSGKIVSMCESISKDYTRYLFLYETMNDYKAKAPFSVTYQYTSTTIQCTHFTSILTTAKELLSRGSIKNRNNCKVSVAFCSGINITFIAINEEDVSFI